MPTLSAAPRPRAKLKLRPALGAGAASPRRAPAQGSVAPRSRPRIAVIGLNFGKYIVDNLASGEGRRHFELAGVCDLDQKKAKAMAARLGVRAYGTLDELLADASVPAVGLFTGPVGRAALVRRIIRAGKDILTTKPFDLDPAAAASVLREAARRGRIIHLNSPSPLPSPDLLQMEQWRDEFRLGRPIGARGAVWANYRELSDGTWYDDPKRCPVAPIFRLGIYLINDLVRFFGAARSVQVSCSRIFTRRPTPDNAQLAIHFKNGALANIYSSFCIDDQQNHRNGLILNFERGTIYRNVGPFPRRDGAEPPTELSLVARAADGKPAIRRRTVSGESGSYQWKAFSNAVRGLPSAGTATPPAEIVEGLKILSAMARSEKSGRTVRVGG